MNESLRRPPEAPRPGHSAHPATGSRREQIYAVLSALAAEVSACELPDFLAEIERAKWTAQLRVAVL